MLSLIKVPAFINNVIQIHETQLVRHGMMVVGEAGSGTLTRILILAKALTKLFEDNIMDRDGSYRKVDRLILNSMESSIYCPMNGLMALFPSLSANVSLVRAKRNSQSLLIWHEIDSSKSEVDACSSHMTEDALYTLMRSVG